MLELIEGRIDSIQFFPNPSYHLSNFKGNNNAVDFWKCEREAPLL